MRLTVVLNVPPGEVLEHLLEALNQPDVVSCVEVVSTGQPDKYRVQQVEDELRIEDATGRLLVAPVGIDEPHKLASDLAHLARYQNVLHLENTADSELAGAIRIDVKQLAFVSLFGEN